MLKKSLLLTMLFLAVFGMVRADEVTIGTGTATTNKAPIGTYYNYSITEQLYTAEEIGTAGTINSISFYYMGNAAKDLPITVFMKGVDEADLSEGGISLADADEVFSGTLSVTTTAGWVTIVLESPFVYDGTSNLLIGFIKDYLYYFSGNTWQGTSTASTMARYTENDYNAYTTSTTPSTTLSTRPNIIIDITPSSGPTCDKPSTFTVDNITGYTADLEWENTGAASYTLEYKNASVDTWTVETGLTTATYALTGLESYTTYNARVKAVCGTELESGYKTLTFTTLEVCPDGFVCIGTGNATNSYLPSNTYYNYALTQQIYTAEEIGQTGAIMSVSFYSTATARTRNLDIYMVYTEKSSFADNTDYITVAATDLVYGGNVTFVQNDWTTIALDSPFQYADDTQNVAVIVHDKTNSYVNSPSYLAFEATGQALYAYNDNYGYDPSTPGTYVPGSSTSTYNFTKGNYKNKIRLVMGELSDCDMPSDLAVSNITMQTANLTWMAGGSETAWQVCINGDEANAIDVTTPSYQMTGLTGATTYTVKVRANCGSSYSYWTPEISFNTAICDETDQCEISYEFTVSGSYTSWHNATIDVVDVQTNLIIATVGYDIAPTGTVTVCNGRVIKFVYNPATPAYYNQYNSYAFNDANGDEIFSGTSTSSISEATELYTYTVDCTVYNCDMPTDLTVSGLNGHGGTFTWESDAESWQVSIDGGRESNVSEKTYTVTGLLPESPHTFAVRAYCGTDGYSKWAELDFTTDVACSDPTDLTVSDIEPTSASVSWEGNAEGYNLRYRMLSADDYATITLYAEDVWQDGTGYQLLLDPTATAYGTIIPENGGLTTSGNASAETYAYFEYKIPTNADGAMNTTNVLIGETVSITVPAGTYDWCVTNPTPGDRIWIAGEGRGDDLEIEGGYTYVFHVQSNGDGGDEVVLTSTEDGTKADPTWTTVEDVTSPYALSSLDPDSDYIVEVQSDCGTDGTSAWISQSFHTPSACQAPEPLDVTDITAYTATLNWNGIQENYQAQYRTKGSRELLFFSDFDDQPSTWTLINAAYNRTSSATTDYFVYLGYNSTETAYLITPDLTDIVNFGTVEFYHRSYNGAATFQVGFSSTTNDVDAFTWGEEVSAAEVFFTAYDVAMPKGTKFVAIKSTTSTTDNYVFVNDFGIYGNEIPAGEWTTVTSNTTSCPISGLTKECEYEWHVRGLNAGCDGGYTEWSELVTFFTLPSCLVPEDLDYEYDEDDNIVLSWTSDATSFDIELNEVLIEDVTSPYTLDFLDPATIYYARVRANCGDGDYSDWTDAIAFVSACDSPKALTYEYGFEDGGDYYACWYSYSTNTSNSLGIINMTDNGLEAYEGDYAFLFSSYSSAETYDQYLYSPELDSNGSQIAVEFYYKAYNSNAETFNVGYSTDGATFTWMDEDISTTDTEWTQFYEVFPAETIYIAIKYTSDYQYYLFVDAFSFTKYVEPSFTQTIELTEGWNWVSINLVIEDEDAAVAMLQQLEEKLGDNATDIQSKDYGTMYEDEEWFGDLDEVGVNNTQTYVIYVVNECTVVLEGTELAAAENYTIEINPGWNWIGFPNGEALDVNEAMSDFAAEELDEIQNKDGGVLYEDGEWFGDFENFEPGTGYMYYYNGTDSQDLIFNTGFKKATRSANNSFGKLNKKSIEFMSVKLESNNKLVDVTKKAINSDKKQKWY